MERLNKKKKSTVESVKEKSACSWDVFTIFYSHVELPARSTE